MNLNAAMGNFIEAASLELLREAGKIAYESGCLAFLVGGAVRDVLLELNTTDIDVMVQGDAKHVATKLSDNINGRILVHNTFGTATLETVNGIKIDFATARTEYYPFPGSLPIVSSSTMEKDLVRRDFSINAMAVALSPDSFGNVVDKFSGLKDLKNKKIRVLHDLSFRDDPTRIFRALRFAARLGFDMDEHTEELLKDAVAKRAMETVSGNRIKKEFQLIACENKSRDIVHLINKYNIAEALCSGLIFNTELPEDERSESDIPYSLDLCDDSTWMSFLASIVFSSDDKVVSDFCNRLAMEKAERKVVETTGAAFIKKLRDSLNMAEKASDIVQTLSGIPAEIIACLHGYGSDCERKKIELFEKRRNVELQVSGNDLAAIGFAKNSFMGVALKKLEAMKIDGEINSRTDELAAAEKILESSRGNEV